MEELNVSGLSVIALAKGCVVHSTMAAGVGIAPTPAGLQPAVQTVYTIQRICLKRTGVMATVVDLVATTPSLFPSLEKMFPLAIEII